MNERPTYGTGFARNAWESAHPELWRGIVGLWSPFLGPTGGTLRDWSGNGKHGVLTGYTAGETSWTAGALNLPGTNEFVDLGVGTIGGLLDGHPGFTMFSWFRAISRGDTEALGLYFRIADGVTGGSMEWLNTNEFRFGARSQTADAFQVFVTVGENFELGRWYFIAGVADFLSDTMTIYVDGIEVLSSGATFGSSVFIDGAHSASTDTIGVRVAFAHAQFRLVGLYNRPLIAAEVAQLAVSPWHLHEPITSPLGVAAAPAGISIPVVMQQMDHFNGGAFL